MEAGVGGKRFLYEGFHWVPVFNLKLTDKPLLIPLAFQIYRVNHKVYIEGLQQVPSHMLLSNHEKAEHFKQERKNQHSIFEAMISKNAVLVLEISEKQAQRYLGMCKNSFSKMIEEKVIVANNSLQIEKLGTIDMNST